MSPSGSLAATPRAISIRWLNVLRWLLPALLACSAACSAPAARDDLSPLRERVAELEARQKQLLEQARSRSTANPSPAPDDLPAAERDTSQKVDLQETARRMALLEAEIASSLDEYNHRRPRKLFPGVRAFSAERTAYEDAMVKRLEHLGTLNYPAEARGKIYGSLLLSVTVDRDGHVVDVVVERSSGQKVLDDAARRVVRMGAPYAPLPERVRQQYDQMVIIRTWSFTRGEALETLQ